MFRLFSVHRMIKLEKGGRDKTRIIILQRCQRRILERGDSARFVGYQRDIFRDPSAALADGVEQNRRLVAENHEECGVPFRDQRAELGDFLLQSCSETVPDGVADSVFFRDPAQLVETARELLSG